MTENYEYCRECGKGHRINLDESPNENYYCGCNSLNNEMADTTHDETEERLLKEIEEELRKGITRNKVLPLDWAMDRITPIIQEAIRQTKAECRKEELEFLKNVHIQLWYYFENGELKILQRELENRIKELQKADEMFNEEEKK